MKKSLIALAVMAASGAAMAQSSVTVYGVADIWFGQVKNSGAAYSVDADGNFQASTDGVSRTKLDSGGVAGSRIGFKGTEDLGGGLKANFVLEQGFSIDSGAATSGQAFSRQSFVSLSGGFGEVKLGKMWTAYDMVQGAANSGFDTALSATNGVFQSTNYSANPGSSVYYSSPEMGGFSAAVSYSFGENKTTTQSATDIVSLNLQYANGPLTAILGYQTEDQTGATPDKDYTRLGATYDFGAAKLLVSYGNEDTGTTDTDEYQIGVDVPLSSNMALSAGYATSKTENAAGATASKRDGYGVALTYSMSKRTTVYAGARRAKAENGSGASTGKSSLYALGLNHTF